MTETAEKPVFDNVIAAQFGQRASSVLADLRRAKAINKGGMMPMNSQGFSLSYSCSDIVPPCGTTADGAESWREEVAFSSALRPFLGRWRAFESQGYICFS